MFDAIVIPGGYAPDKLRMRHAMLDLVRDAIAAGMPVAAIGHGPQVLISAAVVAGRTVTCWPSIAIDVKNAGGLYVDRPVVDDGGMITSRKADDVPSVYGAILRESARRAEPATNDYNRRPCLGTSRSRHTASRETSAASAPWTASTSRCPRAASTASSDRTAPASPRPSSA